MVSLLLYVKLVKPKLTTTACKTEIDIKFHLEWSSTIIFSKKQVKQREKAGSLTAILHNKRNKRTKLIRETFLAKRVQFRKFIQSRKETY